jgi:hypothetical protein
MTYNRSEYMLLELHVTVFLEPVMHLPKTRIRMRAQFNDFKCSGRVRTIPENECITTSRDMKATTTRV